MEFFWQLSGPDNHIIRVWKGGKRDGNAAIASQVFASLSKPHEDGITHNGVDLILGIEESGASHILLPLKEHIPRLNWRNNAKPYPASKFASLSPIHVDTDIRLQSLLDDRQKVSKATKAGKQKGDNSRANGRFWDGQPNSSRAAFEHGRCFWRILKEDLQPKIYDLPDAPWRRSVQIFSLALNFWSPDGTKLTDLLIDAGLTQVSVQSVRKQDVPEKQTWYFRAEEHQGLRNSAEVGVPETGAIPEAWKSFTIPQADIGAKIQSILDTHARPSADPPAPLILLVHDYATIKEFLGPLGILCSRWKCGLKQLLGFDSFDRVRQRLIAQNTTIDPRRGSSSRARSRSPRARTLCSRDTRSPSPSRDYAPVYVVDVVELFKTATGCGDHPRNIRPATIFNQLNCTNEHDELSAGTNSDYTMQSWIIMAQGTTVDEQNAFYNRSESLWPVQADATVPEGADPEAPGLFQQAKPFDLFNDGSDSDDEYN